MIERNQGQSKNTGAERNYGDFGGAGGIDRQLKMC